MNEKPKKESRRALAAHIVIFSLLLTLAFFLRMASIALPMSWVDAMAEAVSTEKFTLEMERVSISLRRGELDIGRIQVYPRGAVRLAVLEMSDTSVKLRPRRNKHPLTWVRSISVHNLIIPASVVETRHGLDSTFVFADSDLSAYIPELRDVELQCDNASVLGASGRHISAKFTAENNTLTFDKIKGNFTRGIEEQQALEGRLEFGLRPFTLTGSGRGTLDPAKIVPIFVSLDLPVLVSEIERFQFQNLPPEAEVSIHYDPAKHRRDLVLNFKSGYCFYSDTPLTSASGILRASGEKGWNHVEINSLVVIRPEGVLSGNLRINSEDYTLAFAAESTLDPLHLLRMIRINEIHPFKLPLSFDNPTYLSGSGIVDLSHHPTRTDVTGSMTSPRISSHGIDFENAQAQCHLSDKLWSVTNATATIYGGRFEGGVDFLPSPTNRANVVLKSKGSFYGLHHAEWSGRFGNPTPDSKGLLDVNYTIAGRIVTNAVDFIHGLHGSASSELHDVQLYRVPLFAGLTEIIASNIPGIDFLLAQDSLDSSVTFTNGVLQINKLNIKGNVFSASGYGTLDHDGQIDLNLKVHLLNRETWLGQSLYYVLFPLSKFFELQATGPLNNPKWSSATFSSKRSPETKAK